MGSVVVADKPLTGPGLGNPVQVPVFLSDFPPFTLPLARCIALHLLTTWWGQPGSHSFPRGGWGPTTVSDHTPSTVPKEGASEPCADSISYHLPSDGVEQGLLHNGHFSGPMKGFRLRIFKQVSQSQREMMAAPSFERLGDGKWNALLSSPWPFLLGKLYYDFLFSVKDVHIRFSFISVCCVYFSRRKIAYGLSFSLVDLVLFL